MPWWPNTGCVQSGQISLHAALALFNSVSTPTAVIPSVYHLRWWAEGLTLRSATSAVFYSKSVTQQRKQVALCALQPAGRGALAFTPRAQLVLTSIQVLKCVHPCAGGNRLCSSHFAWRESRLCSCRRQLRFFSLFLGLRLSLSSLHRVPASLSSGRRIRYLHPRREPTGLHMPCAFPVDSKTRDYEVRSGIAQGAGSLLSLVSVGGDLSQLVKASSPPLAPTTCFGFFSVLCVRLQHQSFSSLTRKIYPFNPFSSPCAVSARPPRCVVSG